jgi:hypothetical protein
MNEEMGVGYVNRRRHRKCVHNSVVLHNLRKESLGRLKCRWKDNIKTDLREIERAVVSLINLLRNRFKYKDEHLMSIEAGNFLNSWIANSAVCSRRTLYHGVGSLIMRA